MEPTRTHDSHDLADYLAMAGRHWWIVILAMLLGTAAGTEYDRRLPREYVSVASVLVYPVGQDANVTGGRTRAEINLDTEAQLVRSTSVLILAAEQLQHGDPESLASSVSVQVPPNTSVLQIRFAAGSAAAAQAGAHAFAESYLRNREATASATIAGQAEALRTKVNELTGNLDDIDSTSQRQAMLSQISQLTMKLGELSTQSISAGAIIRDARAPGRPSKPDTPVNLAAGALLGMLLGLGAAGVRERLDKRVRRANRCGVAVLGDIGDKRIPSDDVYAPFSPGGRAFNRLRNEVVAALDSGEQVLLVTGAGRGPAASYVAANLAAALARTGTDVVLVGAHTPESMREAAPLARLLGVAAVPGLSDVLAGRANLSEATQQAARNPTLRVITAGGTGSACGLRQSQTMRDMIATLRRNTGYVVIEAPSTSAGADAQSLASHADAAILAIELGRANRPDVVDGAEQLRRVGTRVLGAVLLPRVPRVGPVREIPSPKPAPTLNGHTGPAHDQTIQMSTLDPEKLAALDEARDAR